MKIIEKGDEIILRDVPFVSWIFGIILSPFFIFILYTFLKDAIKYPVSTFGLQGSWYLIVFNILWLLFMLAIIGGCIYAFSSWILSPAIVTRIKPEFQTIDVIRRRLIFFKTHQRFYFSQVGKFKLVQRPKDGELLYFHTLTLVNDDQIELESDGSPADYEFYITDKLNDLLKKHHPSANKGKTARLRKRKAKRKMKEPEK